MTAEDFQMAKSLRNVECFALTDEFKNRILPEPLARWKCGAYLSSTGVKLRPHDGVTDASDTLFQMALTALNDKTPLPSWPLASTLQKIASSPDPNRDRIYLAEALMDVINQLPDEARGGERSSTTKEAIVDLTSFQSPYYEIELERQSILLKLQKISPIKIGAPFRPSPEITKRVRNSLDSRDANARSQISRFENLAQLALKDGDDQKARTITHQCLDYITNTFQVELGGIKLPNRIHSLKLVPAYSTLLLIALKASNGKEFTDTLRHLNDAVFDYSPFRSIKGSDEDADRAVVSIQAVLPRCENIDQISSLRKLIFLIDIQSCPYDQIRNKIVGYSDFLASNSRPRDGFVVKASSLDFFENTWHPELSPPIWSP